MKIGLNSGYDATSSPSGLMGAAPLDWEPVIRGCAGLTAELEAMLSTFWETPLRVAFLGAGLKAHYFWRMDDFHVSQLSLGRRSLSVRPTASPEARLKLSDGLCAALLAHALGPKSALFNLKWLSPLETALLNELSRDLLTRFRKTLIRSDLSEPSTDTRQIMAIWTVALEKKPTDGVSQDLLGGKMLLEIPLYAFRLEKKPPSPENLPVVPDPFFFHMRALARIAIGKARLALSDLDGLEPGDLIVLEESNAGTMYLVEPKSLERLRFSPMFRQRGNMTLSYPRELAMTDPQSSTRQTLWDNLMIEVNAELEPVQLPLKQLKEMTEGLVVEMGDLVDNRVSLHVGGKILAWGELLIVGDKFAVRISRLAPDALETGQETMAEPPPVAPENMAVAEAAAQADEVMPAEAAAETSAEDFLNQDFDTFDEDEEEW